MEYSYVKNVLKSIAAAALTAGAPVPTGSISAPTHRTLAVKSSSDYSTQLMRLSSLLDVEKDKVDKFVAAKIEELKATLSTLSRKIAVSTSNVIEARRASDDASTMLVQLDKFIRLNGVAFEKIYKKCDKVLGLQTRAWMNARLANAQFLQQLPILEGMLVTLSDIYSRLRDLEAGPGIATSGGIWVPPESFERFAAPFHCRMRIFR
jgi:SPX domain protein involved in polyphosphate accumulation